MAATGPGVALTIPSGARVEVTVCCYITTPQAQIGLNVRHYRVSSFSGTGVTQGAAVTALDAVFASLYKGCLSANARYRGVRLRVITPPPPYPPAFEVGSDGVGTIAGDLLPWQTCGILSFGTAFAGRAYRGRSYVPFGSEGDNTSAGVPSAGYLTALIAIGSAWIANRVIGSAPNQETLTPILFHRLTSTSDDLTGVNSRTVWGTQRRRSGFGKQNALPF